MATVGGISGRRNEGKRGTRAGGGGRKATGGEAGETKAGERDLLPRIYCYYPEGEKHSSGARRCIRVWGGAFIRCTDLCICIYIYIRV